MPSAVYQEILEHFILPSAERLYGDTGEILDILFQQDLALCSQSGSESRTMVGKRSPPSPSREYMSLSTLTVGQPGTGTVVES